MTGADLMALLKKQPIASVCGLIALACAVALYFRSSAIADARGQFEEKEKEALRIEQNAKHLAGLPEQTEEMKAAGRQVESRLIRAGQLANNLQIYYRLESETGVKLVDVRQAPLPPARPGAARGTYTAVPFNVTVHGSLPQVLAFIRRLETGANFVRFNQVTFTKRVESEATATGESQMNVTLNLEMLGTT